MFDISLTIAYLNTLTQNFDLKIDDTYTLLGLLISPKEPCKRLTTYLEKMYPIFISNYDKIIEIDNLTKTDITEKTINKFQVFNNAITGQIIELLHDKPLTKQEIIKLMTLSESEVTEHLHALYKYDFLIVDDENYSLKRSSFQELADILKKYIDET